MSSAAQQDRNDDELQLTPTRLATQQQLQCNNNTVDAGTTVARTAAAVTMDAETSVEAETSNKCPNTAAAAVANQSKTTTTNIKGAAADINTCLQNSLDQMQQHFQEMVDLILSKLDDMNRQIEDLEKMLENILGDAQRQIGHNPTV
ncbi:hypothetical protein BOX15_Mlig033644g1 [Macrostomum lignano]|uniref:Heat shock factor-binding protein 1 n=1 Tax=Macrostomum lignano TaxID=282301 RepID=A0A267DN51_9PLAT|nr:hypothetical protein BOX15_Mlig033644g1 [Macrostomum lignano]